MPIDLTLEMQEETSTSYIIRGGKEGADRLATLAKVMWPYTYPFLMSAGLVEGMKCLDVGCGNGEITRRFSSIAAFSYSMTFYILSEDRTLKPKAAINASKEMMDGNKLKLFYLFLRFFLLALLCILTLGIGFLFLIPYVNVTMAMFYDDVKQGKRQGDFV